MTYNLSGFQQDLQKERDKLNFWAQLNAMIEKEWIGAGNRMKMLCKMMSRKKCSNQAKDTNEEQ